uniref:Uncharacterized protein n=1 Tax=Glossina pallidipes TaxID=7398 RepID=A0A1B0A3K8_GLOPL
MHGYDEIVFELNYDFCFISNKHKYITSGQIRDLTPVQSNSTKTMPELVNLLTCNKTVFSSPLKVLITTMLLPQEGINYNTKIPLMFLNIVLMLYACVLAVHVKLQVLRDFLVG